MPTVHVSMRVEGLDRSIRRTGNMARGLTSTLRNTTLEWGRHTMQSRLYGMGNYAPPPANSTYERTGDLGAGYRVKRYGQAGVEIFNEVKYAEYVVGRGEGHGQARIHQGRWWLFRERIMAELPSLRRQIARDGWRLWERIR